MDSGLLDIFHDEPLDDGGYANCEENYIDFWSSGSDTMGIQLAETLHGILPIATADDSTLLYTGTIFKDENDYELQNIDNNEFLSTFSSKHTSMFEDFAEISAAEDKPFEVITVDSNGIQSDGSNSSELDEVELGQYDNSQNGYTSFRSRTESSSIGDYESHTSDYDDDDNSVDFNMGKSDDNIGGFEYSHDDANYEDCVINIRNDCCDKIEYKMSVRETAGMNYEKGIIDENFMIPVISSLSVNKSRTLDTNTTASDVDGLDLNVDANTFDLAEFITKDDFLMATPINKSSDSAEIPSVATQSAPMHIIQSKDADSDSDVIIDVETVEVDSWSEQSALQGASDVKGNIELNFEDNVTEDPSWSPKKSLMKADTSSKDVKTTSANKIQQVQYQDSVRSFSLIPNRPQCAFLNGKLATERCKTVYNFRKSKDAVTKSNDIEFENPKQEKYEHQPIRQIASAIKYEFVKSQADNPCANKKGIGMGEGGLSLIKRRRCGSLSESSLEKKELILPENNVASNKAESNQQNSYTPQSVEPIELKSVKKKLNLEEYKQRRGINNICKADNVLPLTEATNIKREKNVHEQNVPDPKMRITGNDSKRLSHLTQPVILKPLPSTSVAAVVQSLKTQAIQPGQSMDPITEAKNKVMRLKEQKKAQLLKIIDSTVSAKVPRVTKVVPLKDIVKDNVNDYQNNKRNPTPANVENDCDEIIIVSAASNTEISIPPKSLVPGCNVGNLRNANNASRSLLKSSALLYNISNTFQKVRASETVKITTNSLITSIHGVVAKRTGASLAVHVPADDSSRTLSKSEEKRMSNKECDDVLYNSVKNADNEHGEDKIIMHLPKDRIRNRTYSASVQTDLLPEFPPLPLPIRTSKRKSRDRKKRRHRNLHRGMHSGVTKRSDTEGDLGSHSSSDYDTSTDNCRLAGAVDPSCLSDAALNVIGRGNGPASCSTLQYSGSSSSSSFSTSFSDTPNSDRTYRNRKSYFKPRVPRKNERSSSNSSIEYLDSSHDGKCKNFGRRNSGSRSHSHSKQRFLDCNVSQPAVEERRIVYVGRIEKELNKEDLRRKFIKYGPIKQITIHYKDTGTKYGFVTYERSQDAFAVIDKSVHDPQINMYDISFGGRRAFCRASYADLDNAGINTYQSYVFPQAEPFFKKEDSFEALLQEVKAKIKKANKSLSNAPKLNGVNI